MERMCISMVENLEGFLTSLFERAEKGLREFDKSDQQIEKIRNEIKRKKAERLKQRKLNKKRGIFHV